MKLIELFIGDDTDGVSAISFVSDPAIEKDFIALSKEKIQLQISDQEKRIASGAILIPDLHILRHDDQGEPYNVFFSKETVEQLSQKYLQDFNQSNVTIEHEVEASDITMVESWIKTDDINDKSIALGIEVPVGTWMGSFKVNNESIWTEMVKTGKVKGFSIEAMLKPKESTNLKTIKMDNKEMSNETLFDKLVALFTKAEPKEEVILEEVKEDKVEYVTKSDFYNAMNKITELLTPAVEEVKVEEPEVIEAKKEVEEVKEVAETIPMTDNTGDVKFTNDTPFEYKLTVSERIANKLKVN